MKQNVQNAKVTYGKVAEIRYGKIKELKNA
jgi:hypothetical protein